MQSLLCRASPGRLGKESSIQNRVYYGHDIWDLRDSAAWEFLDDMDTQRWGFWGFWACAAFRNPQPSAAPVWALRCMICWEEMIQLFKPSAARRRTDMLVWGGRRPCLLQWLRLAVPQLAEAYQQHLLPCILRSPVHSPWHHHMRSYPGPPQTWDKRIDDLL